MTIIEKEEVDTEVEVAVVDAVVEAVARTTTGKGTDLTEKSSSSRARTMRRNINSMRRRRAPLRDRRET